MISSIQQLITRRSIRHLIVDPDEITVDVRGDGSDEYTTGFSTCKNREIVVQVFRLARDEVVSHEGQVLDLSRNGAKLFLSSKLEIGNLIGLKILIDELGVDIQATSTVSWTGVRGHGNWYAGCAFQEELPDELFQKLLDAGYLERRKDGRRKISTHARVLCPNRSTRKVNVALDEYSGGGFRITSRLPMVAGDGFTLEIKSCGTTVQIPAEARWQKKVESGFTIGCKFLTGSGCDIIQSSLSHGRIVHDLHDRRRSDRAKVSKVFGIAGWCWLIMATTILALRLMSFID